MKQTLLLIATLGAMLVAATALSVKVWLGMDADMEVHGWAAMFIGVTLSILVGAGLMVLVFFSSRSGRDDTGRWS
jgi:uncharacterized membrane protein